MHTKAGSSMPVAPLTNPESQASSSAPAPAATTTSPTNPESQASSSAPAPAPTTTSYLGSAVLGGDPLPETGKPTAWGPIGAGGPTRGTLFNIPIKYLQRNGSMGPATLNLGPSKHYTWPYSPYLWSETPSHDPPSPGTPTQEAPPPPVGPARITPPTKGSSTGGATLDAPSRPAPSVRPVFEPSTHLGRDLLIEMSCFGNFPAPGPVPSHIKDCPFCKVTNSLIG
ncbi:hypothetical protein DL546_000666 [Coniochaeta pulveracea]|uniref:Uncharacterized protein n=1 Tax=Coniochaeta pulveracea TaxID=177199 RepID=A0A420YBD9_9PEZI|nr:hypothetical protein DL546_000666 [Coniochaeta pulveracea]